MKKKSAIIIPIAIIVLIALVMSVIYFVARQKERDRIMEEVSARMHYAELFILVNKDGGNSEEMRIFYDDPYYYKQVTFEMEYTREPEEFEVIFYPSGGVEKRAEFLNLYLKINNLDIEGFNGVTSFVTVEDIIYQYDKIQVIVGTMSSADKFTLRNP